MPERILLLGVPRSGTTWLAKALSYADGTRVVREPDNIDAEPDGTGRSALGFGPYPVIDPGEDAPRYRALWDVSFNGRVPNRPGWRRAAGRVIRRLPQGLRDPVVRGAATAMSALPQASSRVVVKSTYAIFTVEWLLQHFGPRVVLLQRNPLNVVTSWADLDIHGFDLLTRPVIRERYLERVGVAPPPPGAPRYQLIAMWVALLAMALNEELARHPEWLVVTHDELCLEPEQGIRDACQRLDVPWNDAMARFLRDSDRPGTGRTQYRTMRDLPERWRRKLSAEDVRDIEAVLERFPSRGWVRAPEAAAA